MIEHTLFHPVGLATDLGAAPLRIQLLERDLVLWRDSTGTVHAADDRCPHRGASLAMGRVVADTLECAYHGWRFEPAGRCIAIPALPDFTPPATHRVCLHAAREAYGLVWVALDAAAGDDALPLFPAEADTRLRQVACGPYDVETSAPRVVENFLDMAHFGYVHEGWLGARDHVGVEPYRVEPTPNGLIATECRAWQPQSSVQATGGAMVEYTYEIVAPYTCLLTKVPDAAAVALDGYREAIALFVCPLTPETSRVWFRLAMADFDSPDQRLRDFQDTIFAQDRPVVESQRPRRLPITPEAPVAELHSAADRASAAYRRYLRERGVTFGVC